MVNERLSVKIMVGGAGGGRLEWGGLWYFGVCILGLGFWYFKVIVGSIVQVDRRIRSFSITIHWFYFTIFAAILASCPSSLHGMAFLNLMASTIISMSSPMKCPS